MAGMPCRSFDIALGSLASLFITGLTPLALAQDGAPPPPAPAGEHANEGWVTVPSRFACDYALLDAVLTDGTTGCFLLDTGAPVGVIDTSVATQLGLPLKSGAARDLGLVRVVKDFEFTLGGDRIIQDQMIVKPLGPLSELIGVKLLGFLGQQFFFEHSVRIDRRARTVSIRTSVEDFEEGDLTPIPLSLAPDGASVMMLVRAPGGPLTGGYAYVNLGFSGALHVPEKRAGQYRITFDAGAPDGRARTMDGFERTPEARADSLGIGPFEFRALRVDISLGGDPDQVVIGSEIWSRFDTLVIDYRRRRLLVEPGARLAEPIGTGSHGLNLMAKGEALDVFAVAVQPGMSAARAGLRAGDTVESLKGVPMNELGFDRAWRLIRSSGRAGEGLRLMVRRDDEHLEIVIPPKRAASKDESKPGPP